MNNVVTFFTNKNKAGAGADFEFIYEINNTRYTFSIFTDNFNLVSEQLSALIKTHKTIDQAISHLNANCSWIIIAYHDYLGKIGVTIRSSNENQQSIFFLEPGDIELQEISKEGSNIIFFDLNKGSHIIVPVDQEAKVKFEDFLKDSKDWFPDDFQINLSYLLRNPSLAHRVYRLETLATESLRDKWYKVRKYPWHKRIPFFLNDVVFSVFKPLILGSGFLLISYASLNQLFPENSFFNCFGQCTSTGSASGKIITEIHEKLSKLGGEKIPGTPPCSDTDNTNPAQSSLEKFKSTINSYKEKIEPYIPSQLYDQYFKNLNEVNSLDELIKDGNIMRGMLHLYLAIESSDYKDYKFIIDQTKDDQRSYIRFHGKSIIESLKIDYSELSSDLNNNPAILLVLRYYNYKKRYTEDDICSFVAVIGRNKPIPSLKPLESELSFTKDKAFTFPNNCKPLKDQTNNYIVNVVNEDKYIEDFMLNIVEKLTPPKN